MAWEIKGTTGSLDALHIDFQSQVKAPKNPKLIREIKKFRKVRVSSIHLNSSIRQNKNISNILLDNSF